MLKDLIRAAKCHTKQFCCSQLPQAKQSVSKTPLGRHVMGGALSPGGTWESQVYTTTLHLRKLLHTKRMNWIQTQAACATKHMSWSKEWKPGNSSGFGGISPPAGQPMALGGNTVVSSFHLCPSVFPLCSLSQLTLGRYAELGKMWCLQCVIFYWYRNVFS